MKDVVLVVAYSYDDGYERVENIFAVHDVDELKGVFNLYNDYPVPDKSYQSLYENGGVVEVQGDSMHVHLQKDFKVQTEGDFGYYLRVLKSKDYLQELRDDYESNVLWVKDAIS